MGHVEYRSCPRARASPCRGVDVPVAVGVCQCERYAGGVDEAAAATVGLGPGRQKVRAARRRRVFRDGVDGSAEKGVGAGSSLMWGDVAQASRTGSFDLLSIGMSSLGNCCRIRTC